MRTPEQIYDKYKNFLSAVSKGEALNAIRLIQEEAYNQALKDAAESATAEQNSYFDHRNCEWRYDDPTVDKESILKLKL